MYWNSVISFIKFCGVCWIVTLDVLKFVLASLSFISKFCWIVTLDVLKYGLNAYLCKIEDSWIVTLDVLKWSIRWSYWECAEVE